jgi:hypothetical protein
VGDEQRDEATEEEQVEEDGFATHKLPRARQTQEPFSTEWELLMLLRHAQALRAATPGRSGVEAAAEAAVRRISDWLSAARDLGGENGGPGVEN